MGLIREPKNVDFYVVDKTWTAKELAEFREVMKQLKQKNKKGQLRSKTGNRKIKSA
jgi:hypothetical protein